MELRGLDKQMRVPSLELGKQPKNVVQGQKVSPNHEEILRERNFRHKKASAPKKRQMLSEKGKFETNYFVYSISVWISWNCGRGRRGGASASLVQQPHEVARTAITQEEVASSRRNIVGFF